MAITDETIEYVAALAKLDLTDEEKERAKKDLGNIIGYVDTMNQLDTTGIEPMSHVFAYHNVFSFINSYYVYYNIVFLPLLYYNNFIEKVIKNEKN